AVAFAMVASFLLSSSLVPVLSAWLMQPKQHGEEHIGAFGRLHAAYTRYIAFTLRSAWIVTGLYACLCLLFLWLAVPRVGTELFPQVAAPLLQIRLRASTGTRIEQTEPLVLKAVDVIKQTIGPENVSITSDYVGTQPASYPVDLIYLFTAGPQEAVLRVGLGQNTKGDEALREHIRSALKKALPQLQVSFEAGDIISQVMSFGSPTPVNIAVQGPDLDD